MNKQRFLKERRLAWKRFEQLIDRRKTGGRSRLTPEQIFEFSQLLREVSNDLATIRSRDWGQGLVNYLNPLVARGHNSFYRSTPASWARIFEFLAVGFPRLFRRNAGYFLVAAALFFVPLAAAWTAVQTDPTVALRIVPSEQLEMFDAMYGGESFAADDDDATDENNTDEKADTSGKPAPDEFDPAGFGEERAAMAGFYVQHNVGIALQCFARGVLLGVGTISTLLFNGIFIGAIAGYVLSLGHTERFLSFVVSHGSFELTAIAVAGGAGLMLGDAFVHAGQRTRLESLRVRGIEAVQIAGGAAVMLVIAAFIEAFWSPAPIPAVVKYVVGGLLWLVVACYLGLSGVRR